MFKKFAAVLLSFVLIAVSCSVSAFALTPEDGITDYPVILVPGYSGTQLVLENDDGTKTPVWGLDMDKVLERVLARVVDLGKGLVLTAKGDAQYIGDVVGGEIVDMLGVLACNPDGTSVNNIKILNPSVEETNTAYIHENGLPENYIGEPDLYPEIASYIGEAKCFSFTEDWRMGVPECATRLDEYIQQVKEYTGKDKVNLLAVSHGGQVTATYLSMFGYKQDVDNAVLTVPAIGGAALAYDIMSDTVKLDEYTLVYFLEHGFVSETEFKWLVQAQQLGFLDDVIHALVPYVKSVIGNFCSIWDFIPAEYYEDVKAQNLDPVENAGLIAKSDAFHNDIMANFSESLQKCIDDYGMNVTIIAGTGNPSVTGLQQNADAIITTNDSTGATTAPYGQRFNDGYTGNHLTCTDASHNHISPDMQVDGSSAYIPENTWYVNELFHGMTFNDQYSRQLAITTLLTDKITDVYSDSAYPQFHASTNACNVVFARFNNSAEGYLSSADTSLVITNISKEHPLQITAITFGGVEFKASTLGLSEIAPGESVEIPVTGTLPDVSRQFMQVSVDYYSDGNLLAPTGRRTFDFTIMNGTPAVFDAENTFVDADCAMGLRAVIGDKQVEKFEKIGILGLLETIFNIINSLFSQLGILDYIAK